ncbi:hypothetical protein AB0I69_11840 [Streptomyces sp. NPDC050508]|uniref:hypothetical protein n=1 Tax=Streptomyces sp. NPDC050508 TaxID=3155405 RepID=UPI00342D27A4
MPAVGHDLLGAGLPEVQAGTAVARVDGGDAAGGGTARLQGVVEEEGAAGFGLVPAPHRVLARHVQLDGAALGGQGRARVLDEPSADVLPRAPGAVGVPAAHADALGEVADEDVQAAGRVDGGGRRALLSPAAAVAVRPVGVLQGLPAAEAVATRILDGVDDIDGDPAAHHLPAAQADEFGGAAGQPGHGEGGRDPAVAEDEGALPLAVARTRLRPEREPSASGGAAPVSRGPAVAAGRLRSDPREPRQTSRHASNANPASAFRRVTRS